MTRWAPARSDVIAEYVDEVLRVHPRGRLLVGLDGIETVVAGPRPAAREAFAADLADAFGARLPAEAVRMGDFTGDTASAEPGRLYDVARFRAEVLQPFRAGARLPGERAVVVVSGAFLHLGELAGMWHTSAWLGLSRAVARTREASRLGCAEDDPGIDGWFAAVDRAFRILDARKLANATFDLTDPEHPRREFQDAC